MKPIVGMFVNQDQIDYLNQQNQSLKSIAIAEATKKTNITLYLFCMRDVNLETKSIKGTYFDQKAQAWNKIDFPYPDILYKRMGTPRVLRQEYIKFREQLDEMGVETINGPAFNKWKVLNLLKSDRQLASHLPLTKLYQNSIDLQQMLERFETVYLKACRGRKGQEVMKVQALEKGLFHFSYYLKGKLHQDQVSFKNLLSVVEAFFSNKAFIVQKAIDLPRLDTSICDMRAEVQRNGRGELDILQIMVRVSQPGAPITQHSSAYLFDDFLAEYADYTKEDISALRAYVKSFLTKIYTLVEKAYGPYGEMGIDFALDQKGHLWFIECNSRPAKVSLMKAADKDTFQRAYANVLEYADYLYNRRT